MTLYRDAGRWYGSAGGGHGPHDTHRVAAAVERALSSRDGEVRAVDLRELIRRMIDTGLELERRSRGLARRAPNGEPWDWTDNT